MGTKKIKYLAIFFFVFIFLQGCGILGLDLWLNGARFNEYRQVVPRKPKFKLKNKPNLIFPKNLDTINIYCLHQKYSNGLIAYQLNNGVPECNDEHKRFTKCDIKSYLKFFSNGRCLELHKHFDSPFEIHTLKEEDLNPNKHNIDKEYYFSKDGRNIDIEWFFPNADYKPYHISTYKLSPDGDTLTLINGWGSVYVREKIPENWRKYRVDW